MARVRSTSELGHWRSNRKWSGEWTEVSAEEITDAMRADPRIEIEETPVEAIEVIEPSPSEAPAPAQKSKTTRRKQR